MDQASSLFVRSDLRLHEPLADARDAIRLPRVVIEFEVHPGATLSWRVPSPAQIRAHRARIWVTRTGDADDYWLTAGDALRLARGERIWISTDANDAAHASITAAYEPDRIASSWLAQWRRVALIVLVVRIAGIAADLAADFRRKLRWRRKR